MSNTQTAVVREVQDKVTIGDAIELMHLGYNVIPIAGKEPTGFKKGGVNKAKTLPLHAGNINFYLRDNTDGVAILIESKLKLNCLDFDCKYDLTGKLFSTFMNILEHTLPDIIKGLLIIKTPNKGYHLFFKCDVTSAKKKLAERPATTQERAKGDTVKPLIELLGTGDYTPVPPSKGYDFYSGDLESIIEITPEERQIILGICKTFNQVEVPEVVGLSKRQQSREDAPWVIFNRQHNWEWMLEQLTTRGWTIVNEDGDRIILRRPGASSKSSGTLFKESNTLYLFTTSTEFPYEEPISAFKLKAYLEHDGDKFAAAKYLAETGFGVFNSEQSEFYTISESSKVEINLGAIAEWTTRTGFRKFRRSESDDDFIIVQIVGNVVHIFPIDKLKKLFCDFVKNDVTEKVYNHFLRNLSTIFSKVGIITLLEDLDITQMLRCTSQTSFVFYKNGALKITDKQELIPYDNLDGLIWADQIKNREFHAGESNGDAAEFIKLIAGKNLNSFRSAIGYLCHPYKDPASPRIPIFTDASFDQNDSEPQGGTGKGLLIKFCDKIVKIICVDGKNFSTKKSFAFQQFSEGTQIIAIEDAEKNFDLEPLFSPTTDGLTVEKKNKTSFTIPYSESPKFLITTNYAIRGSGSSHLRRRFDLELMDTFSSSFTPMDHFHHRFFDDWDNAEWCRFDNYMVECIQLYLSEGLIEPENINLHKKKLIQDTNRNFIEWMDYMTVKNKIPVKIIKEDFKKQFTEMYPDFEKLKVETFSKWVIRWCKEMGISLDTTNGFNGKMAYHFKDEILRAYEKWKVVNEPDNLVNDEIEHWQPMENVQSF
ncbi:bifunctional DNA primase/polymerase [Pollutibacter soli]|uniref:bifunctional DNA primase/polymerase n=1 Tax=Pollutibacter soli TaxID=3034157 RepID=UPI003013C370